MAPERVFGIWWQNFVARALVQPKAWVVNLEVQQSRGTVKRKYGEKARSWALAKGRVVPVKPLIFY